MSKAKKWYRDKPENVEKLEKYVENLQRQGVFRENESLGSKDV